MRTARPVLVRYLPTSMRGSRLGRRGARGVTATTLKDLIHAVDESMLHHPRCDVCKAKCLLSICSRYALLFVFGLCSRLGSVLVSFQIPATKVQYLVCHFRMRHSFKGLLSIPNLLVAQVRISEAAWSKTHAKGFDRPLRRHDCLFSLFTASDHAWFHGLVLSCRACSASLMLPCSTR